MIGTSRNLGSPRWDHIPDQILLVRMVKNHDAIVDRYLMIPRTPSNDSLGCERRNARDESKKNSPCDKLPSDLCEARTLQKTEVEMRLHFREQKVQ